MRVILCQIVFIILAGVPLSLAGLCAEDPTFDRPAYLEAAQAEILVTESLLGDLFAEYAKAPLNPVIHIAVEQTAATLEAKYTLLASYAHSTYLECPEIRDAVFDLFEADQLSASDFIQLSAVISRVEDK